MINDVFKVLDARLEAAGHVFRRKVRTESHGVGSAAHDTTTEDTPLITMTTPLPAQAKNQIPSTAMARLAGLLFLALAILGPFSILYVPSQVLVPNDAAATVANVLAKEGLFRAGMVVDTLICFTEIAVTVLLYRLFEPVNRTLSMMSASARLVMTVLQAGNLALHVVVLRLAAGTQPDLVLALLNAHGDFVLIWQAVFALHCALLAYLVFRSGYFPRALGVLLLLAAAGYLSDSLGRFLMPGYGLQWGWVVAVTAILGEVSFMLWLLIMGVRRPTAVARAATAG